MQFRNGNFIITEEDHCPLYNVREIIQVSDGALTMPAGKSTCLVLAQDIIALTVSDDSCENSFLANTKKEKFACGGCVGKIHFEYEQDDEFTTLKMQLLAAAEQREQLIETTAFARLLRDIDIFSPLSEKDLLDLATLLEFVEYPWQFPITQKGAPGNWLYILLSGKVEVIDENGIVLGELQRGEVFGEMSLLSGEPVSTTVITTDTCQVAVLNHKDFRHILNRFPMLHVFFYKLLASRIIKMNLQHAEDLAPGMVGQLTDISTVELCQMINSNRKTGKLHIEIEGKKAELLFNGGELIHAEMNGLLDKPAFFKILALNSGRFKFTQGLTETEKCYDIVGGFMGMLLEGVGLLDDPTS